MASRSESRESGVNEDFDGENIVKVDEPVGNLSKYYALPPGYSGTPKKGHLMFDACFESGNLGRVDYITEFEYDLFIRPDTCNPRFRVWFNFTVENTAPYQRVIFNVVNFSKTKSLYREGMTPLVKSTSRPKWQRIPAKNCFYYRCPDHRKNYVLSFAFAFDNDTDVYQFAYCFPYTYSRLQNFLDELDGRNLECYKRELLCLTVQQRRVELITITSPKNMKDDTKKRVVFMTARIHPGMPYSWTILVILFVSFLFIILFIRHNPVAQRNGYDVDVNPALGTPTLYRHPIFMDSQLHGPGHSLGSKRAVGSKALGLKMCRGAKIPCWKFLKLVMFWIFYFYFYFFHPGEEPHF